MCYPKQDFSGQASHRGKQARPKVCGGAFDCPAGLDHSLNLPQKAQGHNIAPGEAQWKVGPGGIEVKDLRLASLEQVTAGTWQVRLFYKPTE